MKKVLIPVICFFLIVGAVIFFPVAKRYRINGFYKEFAYVHMLSWDQIDPKYVKAESDQGTVRLNENNLSNAANAIMRVNSLDFLFLTPNTDGLDCVTLTFPDGAVVQIFDAGTDENNKDVAYIINTYQGDTHSFSLTGMATYARVYQCVSPEGYGNSGRNYILNE